MEKNEYYMLSFQSTHAAMGAERALSRVVPVRTMPTLRQVSASCGISLRVEPEHWPALRAFLEGGGLPREEYLLFRVAEGTAHPLTLS